MSARWWTLVVWALVTASALFWGLKLFAKSAPLPPQTQVASTAMPAHGDLTRLLGADALPPSALSATPAAAERFQLVGVVSPRSAKASDEGLALIAVDGRPARAYRVGARIDDHNVLQSVGARGATIGPRGGAALVALNLTPPPPAATGTLPGAATPGAEMVMPPAMLPPPAMPAPPMPPPPTVATPGLPPMPGSAARPFQPPQPAPPGPVVAQPLPALQPQPSQQFPGGQGLQQR